MSESTLHASDKDVQRNLSLASNSHETTISGQVEPRSDFTTATGQPVTDPGYITITEQPGTGEALEALRYQCSLCGKQYDRLDHVKRHMHSHENARPYKCFDCPRRFNRRDLLNRHQATHGSNAAAQRRESKRLNRAIQACQACMLAKAKCDDTRPCRRCANRGISCKNGPANRRSALLSRHNEDDEQPEAATDQTEQNKSQEQPIYYEEPMDTFQDSGTIILQGAFQESVSSTFGMANDGSEAMHVEFDGPTQETDRLDDTFWSDYVFHADLSQIYQDLDFQFDVTPLPVDSELGRLDNISAQGAAGNTNENLSQRTLVLSTSSPNPALLGFEAFKRSPWLWTPANQDHAYAENSQLAVDEGQIMKSPQSNGGHQPKSRKLPEIRQIATRDEILAMALKFSKSAIKVRAFPSLSLLNILMQAFFVREDAAVDPWIHEPSFEPDQCQTQLLAGIVAAGSSFFAAPNIWKMGLALQETVKLAICDALDEDNRYARKLETGQTFLSWIEVGLWSGFRRKMEIGEGFAHTVPTMLRRAGAFQFSHYANMVPPDPLDEGDVLRKKWLDWVEKESYKRLVFRLFINEMRSSIAFVRSPVFSGMELTLPLPSCRSLWDARTPEEWKKRYLCKSHPTGTLSLIDVMHDAARLEIDADAIDLGISAHVIFYGIWGRVWGFLDAKVFHTRDRLHSKKATLLLWLEAQHQELYTHIQTTKAKLTKLKVLSPEAEVMSELLMMSLHVCSEDVQRFAGRFGEEEARSAWPLLQDWVSRDEHRYAIWHAGQLLKAARKLPPTQLRGFLAIAVYHACLTLWVSSLISARPGTVLRRESPGTTAAASGYHGASLSEQRSTIPTSCIKVLLNGEETQATRTYLTVGRGSPCLQLADEVRELHDSTVISKVMMNIFRENFSTKSDPLPPLLENLASLMNDLSKTPAA